MRKASENIGAHVHDISVHRAFISAKGRLFGVQNLVISAFQQIISESGLYHHTKQDAPH